MGADLATMGGFRGNIKVQKGGFSFRFEVSSDENLFWMLASLQFLK